MGNHDSAVYSIFRSEGGGLTVQDIKSSIGEKTPIITALQKEFIHQASSTITKSKNSLIQARLVPKNYLLTSGEEKIDPNNTLKQCNLEAFSVIEYRYQGPLDSKSSKLKIVVEIGGIKCLPVKVTCVSSDKAGDLIEYLKLVCSKLIEKSNKDNKYSPEEWILTLEGEEIIDVAPNKTLEEAEIEHESKLIYHHPNLKITPPPPDPGKMVEVNFRDMNGNTETIKCFPDKPFRLAANKYKKLVNQNDTNYDVKFYYKGKIVNTKDNLKSVGFDPEEEEDIMVSIELE